ncbi:MAG TPA: chemotaxis protein CheD [Rhodocyclaceae bacterium]|nr:chemotaxis protein CheD [Rhodocyclaceae bacterium]
MLLADVFLHPGELWFGGDNARVRTILGSCVAITLWHPRRRIGGMCHYMLPESTNRKACASDGRYAADAIELLCGKIAHHRTFPGEYEAKLFGGGHMFLPLKREAGKFPPVPDRNVAAARELMARHGFRIVAEHLGGHGHRSIIFEVCSGDVWVRQTPLPEEP